ncbi:hypothetical protein Y032_0025g1159 [Ancylostoma ceylanicum]|uniref:Uncharacterized protein n=1 Tax=Ancylostoma ceylanicum TaxID=53326 RepID=A0A016UUJ0_9BILA|nr:hypothetical protein Y032_0025g1159 [Ancylostoma ceylanicum]
MFAQFSSRTLLTIRLAMIEHKINCHLHGLKRNRHQYNREKLEPQDGKGSSFKPACWTRAALTRSQRLDMDAMASTGAEDIFEHEDSIINIVSRTSGHYGTRRVTVERTECE